MGSKRPDNPRTHEIFSARRQQEQQVDVLHTKFFGFETFPVYCILILVPESRFGGFGMPLGMPPGPVLGLDLRARMECEPTCNGVESSFVLHLPQHCVKFTVNIPQ